MKCVEKDLRIVGIRKWKNVGDNRRKWCRVRENFTDGYRYRNGEFVVYGWALFITLPFVYGRKDFLSCNLIY